MRAYSPNATKSSRIFYLKREALVTVESGFWPQPAQLAAYFGDCKSFDILHQAGDQLRRAHHHLHAKGDFRIQRRYAGGFGDLLIAAATNGHLKIIQQYQLCLEGSSVSDVATMVDAIVMAAYGGHGETATYLLSVVNTSDDERLDPQKFALIEAVQGLHVPLRQHLDCLERLLNLNMTPDTSTSSARAMLKACEVGNLKAVELMLRHDSSYLKKWPGLGELCLAEAMKQDNIPISDALLGADIFENKAFAAAHCLSEAAAAGRERVMKWFIDSGYYIKALETSASHMGNDSPYWSVVRAIERALLKGHLTIAKLLLGESIASSEVVEYWQWSIEGDLPSDFDTARFETLQKNLQKL